MTTVWAARCAHPRCEHAQDEFHSHISRKAHYDAIWTLNPTQDKHMEVAPIALGCWQRWPIWWGELLANYLTGEVLVGRTTENPLGPSHISAYLTAAASRGDCRPSATGCLTGGRLVL